LASPGKIWNIIVTKDPQLFRSAEVNLRRALGIK
jgi:hypothetical protein